MTTREEYTQDDNVITITKVREGVIKLRCTCGWKDKAIGSNSTTEAVEGHILDHDIAYEEGLYGTSS